MEFRVLKYFLAVAQEENITKAADVLHTTQSNLSRQLAELERETGKKIVHARQQKDNAYRRRNVFTQARKRDY